MGAAVPPPGLDVVRVPGETGPILKCAGELTAATVPILRRELDPLIPLDHPGIVLNLADCRYLDVDGLLALFLAFKELRERGRQLAIVAGRGTVAHLLRVLGVDSVLSVFPSEEVAVRALRGGGPRPPAPATWAAARVKTIARWKAIRELLEEAPPAKILRELTAMTPLCHRAEEILWVLAPSDRVDRPAAPPPLETAVRCRFCPLFEALGARPEDVGCRSALDPIFAAVQSGDMATARERIDALIQTLETMSVSEKRPKGGAPDARDAAARAGAGGDGAAETG